MLRYILAIIVILFLVRNVFAPEYDLKVLEDEYNQLYHKNWEFVLILQYSWYLNLPIYTQGEIETYKGRGIIWKNCDSSCIVIKHGKDYDVLWFRRLK